MTDTSSDLVALIEHVGADASSMDSDAVRRLFALAAGGRVFEADEALLAFSREMLSASDTLPLQIGRWRIDARRQVIKSALLTTLASIALVGSEQFSPEALTLTFVISIVPSVFDIERVELTAGQEYLLVELRKKPAFSTGFATPDELYASLPADVRRTTNRMDFADFMQAVDRMGAFEHGAGGTLRIRTQGTSDS